MSDIMGTVQYCHRNRGAYSGSEMSPVLHGLMSSRDQTMPEGSASMVAWNTSVRCWVYGPAFAFSEFHAGGGCCRTRPRLHAGVTCCVEMRYGGRSDSTNRERFHHACHQVRCLRCVLTVGHGSGPSVGRIGSCRGSLSFTGHACRVGSNAYNS